MASTIFSLASNDNVPRDFITQAVRDLRIVFTAFQTSSKVPLLTLKQLHEIVKLTRGMIEYETVEELAVLAEVDTDGELTWDTTIGFKEFVRYFINHMNCGLFMVRKREVFRAMDCDGSGEITAAELVRSLRSMGFSINLDESLAMTSIADTSRDGLITYAEFKHIWNRIGASSENLILSDSTTEPRPPKRFDFAANSPFNWTKSINVGERSDNSDENNDAD